MLFLGRLAEDMSVARIRVRSWTDKKDYRYFDGRTKRDMSALTFVLVAVVKGLE